MKLIVIYSMYLFTLNCDQLCKALQPTEYICKLCVKPGEITDLEMFSNDTYKLAVCVNQSYSNYTSVLIANHTLTINNSLNKLGCRWTVAELCGDKHVLQFEFKRNNTKSQLKYKIQQNEGLMNESQYSFKLNIIGPLRFCENDSSDALITNTIHEAILIHICYVSDSKSINQLIINNKTYAVNTTDSEDSVVFSVDNYIETYQHFLVIYIRNISASHANNYTVDISQFKRESLQAHFQIILENEQDFSVIGCDGKELYLFYFIAMNENFSLCLKLQSSFQNITITNVTYNLIGSINHPKGLEPDNVKINITRQQINILIHNINFLNFGRNDLYIMFGIYNKSYTFYLFEDTEEKFSVSEKAHNYGGKQNFVFSFQQYGISDKTILVNNESFPIFHNISEGDVFSYGTIGRDSFIWKERNQIVVSSAWNPTLNSKCIYIYVLCTLWTQLQIQEMSTNKVFTFNINSSVCIPEAGTDEPGVTDISINSTVTNVALIPDHSSVNLFLIPTVIFIVCMSLLILAMRLLQRAKNRNKTTITALERSYISSGSDVMDTGTYVNINQTSESIYMNVQTGRENTARYVTNANGPSDQSHQHIYMNSRSLERRALLNASNSTLDDEESDGRHISEDGLVYVTVSTDENVRKVKPSRSRKSEINYASLDLQRSGKLILRDHRRTRHLK
ncbi:uncharacterized protein LOC106059655 [Biomphalaria glabrata]|uniref:Uncharacterized protein LOC106059655 n=1 Tax=Biomphalaria glabrata TaxID=6526 RepID=A0A9W2YX88_BIOGL|nr:uncharacterized protein LOC106059655 [Biomphalaria glabrata]